MKITKKDIDMVYAAMKIAIDDMVKLLGVEWRIVEINPQRIDFVVGGEPVIPTISFQLVFFPANGNQRIAEMVVFPLQRSYRNMTIEMLCQMTKEITYRQVAVIMLKQDFLERYAFKQETYIIKP